MRFASAMALMLAVLPGPCAWGRDIVINYAADSTIAASGVDQPQLSVVAYNAGGLMHDTSGAPYYFDAYIDTGASGIVMSSLTARGYWIDDWFEGPVFVPGLGIDGTPSGEFVGPYTDYGVAGPEIGDTTSPIGLRVRNGVPLAPIFDWETFEYIMPVINPAEFTDVGQHQLWVRRQPGFGEIQEVFGLSMVQPMNIVGMPVIRQSKMVMDPTTIAADEDGNVIPMSTYLLPKDAPTDPTNMSFRLRMNDFVGTPPAGEVPPSHARNPVFDNVTIRHDDGTGVRSSTGNTWLFDTGSTASMVGFAQAQQIGLIDSSYASYDEFVDDWSGVTLTFAGIGSITEATTAPLMTVDEIAIPDAQGNMVVWRDVDVLVLDIAGLDGVFGMNLILPASTMDLLGLTELNSSPGYFDRIIFNTIDDQWADLSLFYNPGLPGDANSDGAVDFADYLVLEANYGQDGQFNQGDFTADGKIDFADYLVLEATFGTGAVPEPSTLSLLLLAGAALLRRRRGQRL